MCSGVGMGKEDTWGLLIHLNLVNQVDDQSSYKSWSMTEKILMLIVLGNTVTCVLPVFTLFSIITSRGFISAVHQGVHTETFSHTTFSKTIPKKGPRQWPQSNSWIQQLVNFAARQMVELLMLHEVFLLLARLSEMCSSAVSLWRSWWEERSFSGYL